MCLILIGFKTSPQVDLVVAANRDEFYQRPSRAAHFWPDAPEVLAGQDLQAGGTWLGISAQGRFAAITNVRDGLTPDASKRSRGELTRDFLTGQIPPMDYVKEIMRKADDYRGFNLLVGDQTALIYCNNQTGTFQTGNVQSLAPGFYGLSNHLLDTPWPKVQRGKQGLIDAVSDETLNHRALSDKLFSVLANNDIAPDDQLPGTGVNIETERRLSSLFIKSEQYGTCNSTVVIIDQDDQGKPQAYFRERCFYQEPPTEVEFTLPLRL